MAASGLDQLHNMLLSMSKKRIVFAWMCAAVLLSAPVAICQPLTIAVRPSTVEGSATKDIVRALAEARRARELGAGPIVIQLEAGLYRITEPIKLTWADSGTAANPLTIRARPDAEVHITGSVLLDSRDLLPTAELPRGSPIKAFAFARSHVSGATLHDVMKIDVSQGGKLLQLARWPKQGYEYSEIKDADRQGRTFKLKSNYGAGRGPFAFAAGYWAEDWFFEYASLVDLTEPRLLEFSRIDPKYPLRGRARYAIYNSLSDISAPGEYAIDPGGRLYAWPYPGGASIEVANIQNLLSVSNASHIVIEGIAFENCTRTGIAISSAEHISIKDSMVRRAGGAGIAVSGSRNVGIDRVVVTDVGRSGIELSGGDRNALTPGLNRVGDSIITRFAQADRTYNAGVRIEGVGNSVRGSFIGFGPHIGVQFSGNDHKIEGNELTRLVLETSDAGAIQAWRDWTARGTIIENNYVHDIVPLTGKSLSGKEYDVKGIYLDDFQSGTIVRNNRFDSVMYPVFVGGGRDNVIQHNVFVNTFPAAVHIDARGTSWASSEVKNADSEIRTALHRVPYRKEPYSSRYDHLADLLTDEPEWPKWNVIGPNAVCRSNYLDFGPTIASKQVIIGSLKKDAVSEPGGGKNEDCETGISVSGFRNRSLLNLKYVEYVRMD